MTRNRKKRREQKEYEEGQVNFLPHIVISTWATERSSGSSIHRIENETWSIDNILIIFAPKTFYGKEFKRKKQILLATQCITVIIDF